MAKTTYDQMIDEILAGGYVAPEDLMSALEDEDQDIPVPPLDLTPAQEPRKRGVLERIGEKLRPVQAVVNAPGATTGRLAGALMPEAYNRAWAENLQAPDETQTGWETVAKAPGAGQTAAEALFGDTTGSPWKQTAKAATGIVGDILTDPLTYVPPLAVGKRLAGVAGGARMLGTALKGERLPLEIATALGREGLATAKPLELAARGASQVLASPLAGIAYTPEILRGIGGGLGNAWEQAKQGDISGAAAGGTQSLLMAGIAGLIGHGIWSERQGAQVLAAAARERATGRVTPPAGALVTPPTAAPPPPPAAAPRSTPGGMIPEPIRPEGEGWGPPTRPDLGPPIPLEPPPGWVPPAVEALVTPEAAPTRPAVQEFVPSPEPTPAPPPAIVPEGTVAVEVAPGQFRQAEAAPARAAESVVLPEALVAAPEAPRRVEAAPMAEEPGQVAPVLPEAAQAPQIDIPAAIRDALATNPWLTADRLARTPAMKALFPGKSREKIAVEIRKVRSQAALERAASMASLEEAPVEAPAAPVAQQTAPEIIAQRLVTERPDSWKGRWPPDPKSSAAVNILAGHLMTGTHMGRREATRLIRTALAAGYKAPPAEEAAAAAAKELTPVLKDEKAAVAAKRKLDRAKAALEKGRELTKAQVTEVERLAAKDPAKLTEADRARLDELGGGLAGVKAEARAVEAKQVLEPVEEAAVTPGLVKVEELHVPEDVKELGAYTDHVRSLGDLEGSVEASRLADHPDELGRLADQLEAMGIRGFNQDDKRYRGMQGRRLLAQDAIKALKRTNVTELRKPVKELTALVGGEKSTLATEITGAEAGAQGLSPQKAPTPAKAEDQVAVVIEQLKQAQETRLKLLGKQGAEPTEAMVISRVGEGGLPNPVEWLRNKTGKNLMDLKPEARRKAQADWLKEMKGRLAAEGEKKGPKLPPATADFLGLSQAWEAVKLAFKGTKTADGRTADEAMQESLKMLKKAAREVPPKPASAEVLKAATGQINRGIDVEKAGPQEKHEMFVRLSKLDDFDEEEKQLYGTLAQALNPALSRSIRQSTLSQQVDALRLISEHDDAELAKMGAMPSTVDALRRVTAARIRDINGAKTALLQAGMVSGEKERTAAIDMASGKLLDATARWNLVAHSLANKRTNVARTMAMLRHGYEAADVTLSQRGQIMSRMRAAGMSKPVIEKAMAILAKGDVESLREFIRKATDPDWLDKVLFWWKAGLIGPTALVANTVGNVTLAGITDIANMVVAPGIEGILAKAQGRKRERFFGETTARLAGYKAVWGGPDGALTVLVRDVLGSLNIINPKVIEAPFGGEGLADIRQPAIGGKAGERIAWSFKILSAFDNFNKKMRAGQELYAQIYRLHRYSGGSHEKALAGFVKDAQGALEVLKAGPKSEQWKHLKGILESVKQHYDRDTLQAPLKGIAQAVNTGVMNNRGWQFLVPFTKTPANSIIETLMMTPVGFAAALRKLHKGELRGGDLAEELAKPVLGSTIAMGIGLMAAEGLITGGGDPDWRKQQALEETGWQPYSVKIGDQYVSYARVQPLAGVVGMVADMIEGYNQGEFNTPTKAAVRVSASIGENITNQTFLSGLQGFFTAWSDPVRYGERLAKQLTGSVVPNVIAKTAQVFDPAFRETKGSLTAALMARIPGFSTTLPAQRTPTGAERERPGSALERFASPFARTEVKEGDNSDVAREMYMVGKVPAKAPQFITVPRYGKVTLAPGEVEEFQRAHELATKRMARIIKDPTYLALPLNDDDAAAKGRIGSKTRYDVIENVYRKFRQEARRKLVKRVYTRARREKVA